MGHSETHRRLHGYFNDRAFDTMAADVRTDLMFEDVPRQMTMKNFDEFKDWLGEWSKGFSDAEVTSAEYVDGPDYSLARFRGVGINDGQMGPFQPTQRRMDVQFWEMMHFDADGMVTSGEIIYDQATILAQLGHIELPA